MHHSAIMTVKLVRHFNLMTKVIVVKKLLILSTAVSSILLYSCNNKTAKGKSRVTDNAHNSANSLDWPGTYKGTLPCVDCQGILTELTLNNDNRYVLSTKYLGKDSVAKVENGNFSWTKEGNTIILADVKNKPGHYLIGENRVTQLDMEGNKITGSLADNYILTKQPGTMNSENKPNAELVETYWKLTELMSKPIDPPAGVREIHIVLKKQDNRIQGFTGCNNIMGSYELKEGNSIRFQNLAGTKMTCTDMTIENQLKEILVRADNYSILGDKLSLNKAKMAPLARFEAIYH